MDSVSGNKAKDYSQGELTGFLKSAGYESSQVFKF
jgi:cytochrome-b5 reductase